MILTNKLNLSTPWRILLSQETYVKAGDRSSTEINRPIQQIVLLDRHKDSCTWDIGGGTRSMLGNGAHALWETMKIPEDEVEIVREKRMLHVVDGVEFSVKPDWLEKIPDTDEWILRDLKTCNTFLHNKPAKIEWIQQFNTNAYVARQHGFNVTQIFAECWYTDWKQSEAIKSKAYPQHDIATVKIPIWDDDTCIEYIKDRLADIAEASTLADEGLPECTGAERWAKHPYWKVLSTKGAKRAIKGGAYFDTEFAAEAFMGSKPDCRVEKIVDNPTKRCDKYCTVKFFCHQFRRLTNRTARF